MFDDTDMPIGLIMSLTKDEEVLRNYCNLDTTAKNRIKEYIKDSNTGDQAKTKIEDTIKHLQNPNSNLI